SLPKQEACGKTPPGPPLRRGGRTEGRGSDRKGPEFEAASSASSPNLGTTIPPLRKGGPGGGRQASTGVREGDSRAASQRDPANRRSGAKVLSLPRSLRVTFGRGDVNLAAIAVGATIWRTDDPALRRRLERSFAGDVVVPRIPLSLEFTGDV